MKKSKAQSTIEYLLVFGGIVLAVIYGANQLAKSSKRMADQGNKSMCVTTDKLNTALGID